MALFHVQSKHLVKGSIKAKQVMFYRDSLENTAQQIK